MANGFPAIFEALKSILAAYEDLLVAKQQQGQYVLVSKRPSPFPQHKGNPLDFAYLKTGKAYVSFHLMAMDGISAKVPDLLAPRRQGKTCFNFKTMPDAAMLAALARLTEDAFQDWHEKEWV